MGSFMKFGPTFFSHQTSIKYFVLTHIGWHRNLRSGREGGILDTCSLFHQNYAETDDKISENVGHLTVRRDSEAHYIKS